MHCDICGRRMQGQWNHGTAYYRCKYPTDYPEPEGGHPRSVYVREAAVTPGLDQWLAQLFDDDHIEHTCQTLAGVSEPDPGSIEREQRLRAGIADCDRRIAKYHQLLDHDVDPALAASWITEAQRERRGLEAQLGQRIPGEQLSTGQVKLSWSRSETSSELSPPRTRPTRPISTGSSASRCATTPAAPSLRRLNPVG